MQALEDSQGQRVGGRHLGKEGISFSLMGGDTASGAAWEVFYLDLKACTNPFLTQVKGTGLFL